MHKSAWSPTYQAKAHQGKSKAQKKTKPNACAEHLRGQGEQKGEKTGTVRKSPLTHNLSTQSQEQSQAKQHLGPAPKA